MRLAKTVIMSIIPEGIILTSIFENYKLVILAIFAYISYKELRKGKCSSLVVFATLLYSLTIIGYFRILIGIQVLSKSMEALIENLLALLSVDRNIMPLSISLIEGLVLITLYIIARETENLNKIVNYLMKSNFPSGDVEEITTGHLYSLTFSLGASLGTLMLALYFQGLKLISLSDIRISLLIAIMLIIVIGLIIYRIYKE